MRKISWLILILFLSINAFALQGDECFKDALTDGWSVSDAADLCKGVDDECFKGKRAFGRSVYNAATICKY